MRAQLRRYGTDIAKWGFQGVETSWVWQKYHLLQPLRYVPHNNRLGAQGPAFLRIEKTSILSNGFCFELLVLADDDHCISNPPVPSFIFLEGVDVAFVGLGCNPSDRCNLSDRSINPPTQQTHCLAGHRDAPLE
jgi:hypothetical protein